MKTLLFYLTNRVADNREFDEYDVSVRSADGGRKLVGVAPRQSFKRQQPFQDGWNSGTCWPACIGLQNGGGGIRTSTNNPANFALPDTGGAESGALAVVDPRLGSLINAWPALPEPIRAGILAMVRAVGGTG